MRIRIVTPLAPNAVIGNEHTARRYAHLLRALGHRVDVTGSPDVQPCDLLVALHARRSHAALERFATAYPERPRVLVLTGTDVYRDIHTDASAQQALEIATRLVVLQRHALTELPPRLRDKSRVIYQSAACLWATVRRPVNSFRVAVVGHLRPEKDPFRTALAVRQLPPASRIAVLHVGAALTPDMAAVAAHETATNRRYRWLGELPHWKTRRLLASSHLLSITSLLEGSSNVLCEALAQISPTPVVASRIGGLMGTLGDDYPGFYPTENTRALAALLERAETDAAFYSQLQARCAAAAPLVQADREREAWSRLLAELT